MQISELKFQYDKEVVATTEFVSTLPDLQNGDTIKGAKVAIQRVGVHGLSLPLKIKMKSGEIQEVQGIISASVSLESHLKGINMSRLVRSFYTFKDDIFDIDKLGEVLLEYKKKLVSFDAHLHLSFNYRQWQDALISKKEDGTPEGGWIYNKVVLETNLNKAGELQKILHYNYIYSSTCPCSTELALHAMQQRGIYAAPHNQRSVAKVSLKFNDFIWIEDIDRMCELALGTPVRIFVKRPDEQVQAILSGSERPNDDGTSSGGPKFVEDAARLLFERFDKNEKILDFKVLCSHNESLHPFAAKSLIVKGLVGGYTDDESFVEFEALNY